MAKDNFTTADAKFDDALAESSSSAAATPVDEASLREKIVAELDALSVARARDRLPGLYARIIASVRARPGTNWGKLGFVLALDDPFAAGALRVYCETTGMSPGSLPAVLPHADAASRVALESYIVRAGGAGDTERVNAAQEALKRTKK